MPLVYHLPIYLHTPVHLDLKLAQETRSAPKIISSPLEGMSNCILKAVSRQGLPLDKITDLYHISDSSIQNWISK